MVWTDGRKYEGQWKNDEKDGEGHYANEEGEEVKQKWLFGKLIAEEEKTEKKD